MQQPGGQTWNGEAPIQNGGAGHHCLPPADDGPESWVKTKRKLTQVQVPEMGSLRSHGATQGCIEVRWHPGQEASLVPPCSNLRSFGSKCTVLKKTLATLLGVFGATQWFGSRDTVPPSLRPWCDTSQQSAQLWNSQSPECRTPVAELKDHNYVSSTLYPEFPQKTGEASPAG